MVAETPDGHDLESSSAAVSVGGGDDGDDDNSDIISLCERKISLDESGCVPKIRWFVDDDEVARMLLLCSHVVL